MGLFKKLFQRKVIETERQQVKRPVRVKVTDLHRLVFRPIEKKAEIRIGNISHKGIGFLREDLRGSKVGDMLRGNLEINQTIYDVQAKVQQVTPAIAGCQFLNPTDFLEKAIQEYFRMEILGLSLNQISVEYLKADPSGRPVWFTDTRQNEIYYTVDQNGIAEFHISFLGNYLEGGRNRRLRSGHVIDYEKHENRYQGSALIDLAEGSNEQIVALATTMIQTMENMPLEEQQEFLRLLGAR